MLLNHTGCGFTTFTDKELNDKLSLEKRVTRRRSRCACFPSRTPRRTPARRSRRSGSHPWIAKDVPVRGFISTWTQVGCGKSSTDDWRGRPCLRFRALRYLRVLRSDAYRPPRNVKRDVNRFGPFTNEPS